MLWCADDGGPMFVMSSQESSHQQDTGQQRTEGESQVETEVCVQGFF